MVVFVVALEDAALGRSAVARSSTLNPKMIPRWITPQNIGNPFIVSKKKKRNTEIPAVVRTVVEQRLPSMIVLLPLYPRP